MRLPKYKQDQGMKRYFSADSVELDISIDWGSGEESLSYRGVLDVTYSPESINMFSVRTECLAQAIKEIVADE